MDQIKIGKFIADCRREKSLTQSQLAEKLNITDRAVSKWETGRAMPDSSIMLELCAILDITVTDLLNGERVEGDRPDIKDAQILEIVKEKQQADKRLLNIEIFLGVLATCILLAGCMVASFVTMPDWLKFTIIGVGAVIAIPSLLMCTKIEQVAGYYKCEKCGNVYVPTYSQVIGAMHYNRTRYMKCPCCHKWSWQKKTVEKEEIPENNVEITK